MQALGRIALPQFGQIETGGKVIADAVQHHRADAIGQVREAALDVLHQAVIERVALGRTVEADRQYRAGLIDRELRGRRSGGGGGRGAGCGGSGVSHADVMSFIE